jgi:hypothetical protein
MEQNQNPFATADAAWPSPPTPLAQLPAVTSEASSILDFDPIALRARCDGWTPERQRAFIEELADCGVVREAAGRVGMTEQSANRLRRRADAAAFNVAWDAAIRIGVDRLRSIAYERAVNGTVRHRYYRGELVGEERLYSDRLLIYLLGKAERVADQLEVTQAVRDWDSWMEAIEQGLDRPMPAPDQTLRSPAWQAEKGGWWTDFPPPAGFNGEQVGAPGDKDYRRECTLDEIGAIEAAKARAQADQSRRRDLYFDPDKMTFRPPR